METQNLQIDPHIYGDLLQGCVYERDLFLGQQIHAQIIKKTQTLEDQNEYIETKLVVFYAKCNLFEVAARLFCRLSKKNVFSWAAMIGLYCRNGSGKGALLGFLEMMENGVEADNFVVPSVLKACGGLQLIGFGKGIHGYVAKMGMDGCVFVASSLIDMYGKCGVLGNARKVFDKMSERNVVTWNTMVVSYVQNEMYEEAIGIFHDMREEGIEPSHVTLVSFLSASANLYALEEGMQGHAISILSGLVLNNMLGGSIMNFYLKVGMIKDAELVFSRMHEKDVVTWNLLISCYVQCDQVESAFRLCYLMRLEGLKFDSVTLASILSASAKTENIRLGKEAHCHCIRNNLISDVDIGCSLIDLYAKCDKIVKARRIFDSAAGKDLVLWNKLLATYAEIGSSGETLKLFYQMQLDNVPPNVVSWNSVILGFLRNNQVKEAVDMFLEMQLLGINPNLITYTTLITGMAKLGFSNEAISMFQKMQEAGITPNSLSIVGLLSACRDKASLQYGRAIHGYIVRREISLYVPLVTSLLNMYAKCGTLDQAEKVFGITTKDLPLYNAMISCYASHGRGLEALALFRHLEKESVKPDGITFTCVLSACRHSGLIIKGLEVFVDMISKHNVNPSMEHYGCVVSLLSQCGSFREALQLIVAMPLNPDARILGSLLSACRQLNEMELAKYLAERLTKMEPDDSGNYVALSNAYAAAGRWKEKAELRILMKKKGIRKRPGCSWIHVGGEEHVFVSGDRSHAQTEEIHGTLELLGTEMKTIGCDPMLGNPEILCS